MILDCFSHSKDRVHHDRILCGFGCQATLTVGLPPAAGYVLVDRAQAGDAWHCFFMLRFESPFFR